MTALDISALDVSSVLGLGAMTLLTLNILLGMLVSTHYNPVRRCLAIVVLTSRVRRSLGRRLWKRVHFLTYLLAPLFLVHGLLTDPELKDRPTDFVDA